MIIRRRHANILKTYEEALVGVHLEKKEEQGDVLHDNTHQPSASITPLSDAFHDPPTLITFADVAGAAVDTVYAMKPQ